jgi:hypothetical protein
MSYITISDVSNELNGLTINGSSVPSSSTVDSWITQETSILNRETGRVWGTESVTDEYYDYDGSGILRLNNAPVISIDSISYEKNGINAATELWVSLTEGRTSAYDFFVYKDEAELHFHGTSKPTSGFQNIKVSYTYGYETINETVKSILSKIVALRVIDSIINGQSTQEGGSITVDVITISDPTTFSLNRVKQLKQDISDLKSTLGKFKNYRYNRRWI